MIRRWSLYLPLLLATILFSCAEESIEPAPAGKLTGEYDFISLSVDGVTTSETTQSGALVGKMVVKVIYTSKNNAGTYTLDGKKIIGTDVSYSIDTTLETRAYTGDPADDPIEADVPFIIDMPAYSSTGTYKVIGADSIYFEGGFINGPVSAGQPMTSPPSGAKFLAIGKDLVIVSQFSHVTTTSQMGAIMRSTTNGRTAVRLRKRELKRKMSF